MHASTYSSRSHFVDEIITRNRCVATQTYDIQVPSMHFAGRGLGGKLKAEVLKPLFISASQFFPFAKKAIQFSKLVNADGGGDICHVVLESRRYNAVGPSWHTRRVPVERIAVDTMQPHDAAARRQLRPRGNDHPALPGSQRLRSIEAEYGGVTPQR